MPLKTVWIYWTANLIKSSYGLQDIWSTGEVCLYFNSSMRLGMVVKSWSAHIVACSPMTWADTVVTYNINSNSKLINEAHLDLLGEFFSQFGTNPLMWRSRSFLSFTTHSFNSVQLGLHPASFLYIVRWVEGHSWRIVARRGANGQKRSWTGFLRF